MTETTITDYNARVEAVAEAMWPILCPFLDGITWKRATANPGESLSRRVAMIREAARAAIKVGQEHATANGDTAP